MGLFDYALSDFNPYQGGILGALGSNNMAALAQVYGGYGKPDATDVRGIEPQFSMQPAQQPGIPAPPPTNIVEAPGQWTRPGSFLRDMFQGPFNAPLPPSAPSPYDESGFAGAFPNAPPMGAPQTANIPMPTPRPPGLGQQPAQQQPGQPLNILPQSVNAMPQNQEASLPPNAQLTQGQAPQQALPQQQGGGFLEGLSNFSHNLGSTPGLPGIIDAIRGTQTGQRYDAAGKAEQNQANMARAIHGALVQRGIPPQQAIAIAQAAATDPKLAEALLPQALGLKPADTIEGAIARDLQRPGPNGAMGGSGTGSAFDMLTKLEESKARGAAAGKTTGERVANAQLDLPSAVANAKEALRITEELKTHPGRSGIGWHGYASNYIPDTAIPGNTAAFDANRMLSQLKGGAFLQAFNTLKGGGQITEVEGAKATDAIARMNRASSRSEFDKALTDYQGVIRLGIDRASQMAGKEPPNGFKGNSEWQQVQPGVRIRQVQ